MIGSAAIAGARFADVRAGNFNGTDEYAYVDSPNFGGDQAGTFLGWVTLASLLGANGNKGILSWGFTSGADDSQWGLRQVRSAATSNQNRIQHINRIISGGTLITNNGDTALAASTLYHLVISSNGSTTTIRLNNVAQTLSGTNSGNWLGDLTFGTKRLAFGCFYSSGAVSTYLDGRMNEWLYVTGRALSAGEITEHYNSGVPRSVRGLSFIADVRAHWRFGDRGDSGTTILDRIGTSHLTLVNMDATNYGTP